MLTASGNPTAIPAIIIIMAPKPILIQIDEEDEGVTAAAEVDSVILYYKIVDIGIIIVFRIGLHCIRRNVNYSRKICFDATESCFLFFLFE